MKIAKTISVKSLGAGKAPADEQMAKINKFALVQLSPEQVHVRRYLMCHNGIDRDNERFSEELLNNFAATLPGKGFFAEGHPGSWSGKGGPGEGRFFDAVTEEMTPEAFQQLTGETCKLPDGMMSVKVLWGDTYLLKLDSNADTLAKIDAGIYSFVSIGFKAPMFDVTDDRGNYIYGEYRPNGEALEGSLVWLGAQPGASAQKGAEKENHRDTEENKKGGALMKEFIKTLSKKLGKTFTEDAAVDEIASIISEKDAEIAGLKPKAADGEAYRKELVQDALKFGTLIGDIEDGEEKQKAEEEFLAGLSIDRLKMFKDKYEVQARKSFPDKFTFKSKDETDRQKAAGEAKKKAGEAGKKKDYTDPAQNELLKS